METSSWIKAIRIVNNDIESSPYGTDEQGIVVYKKGLGMVGVQFLADFQTALEM